MGTSDAIQCGLVVSAGGGSVKQPLYSIALRWPDFKIFPGWRDVGRSGTKDERLKYIEEVWTDMRPLSLRKKMDAG